MSAAPSRRIAFRHVPRIVELIAPGRLGTKFRWLLASTWVSTLGDGFALAAGPLLVASETRNAQLVALATLLQRLPWLLFGLFAGAISDRFNRQAIIVIANTVRAALLTFLGLALVAGHVHIALVLVVLTVLGTAEVFTDNADSSIVPMLVSRDDLAVANARVMAGYLTIQQMIGPPIGAALFAAGRSMPFFGQAIVTVLGAVLIVRVGTPTPEPKPTAVRAVFAEIGEGLRWVWHNPPTRTLAVTILIFNITYGAPWSILVLYAKRHLHLGSVGFGLLTTIVAAGGLAGIASYDWITKRISLGNVMRLGLIFETLSHLAFATVSVTWIVMVLFFIFGAHAFIWGTTSITVRQKAAPQEMLGRVGSINALCTYGGLVIGAAIGGPIAQKWGVTAPYWFAFGGSAIFLVVIWKQLTHIAHADESPESAR
jgi:MFS family permease